MSRRRKKRVFLMSNDHLLDISPAGRNIFVSRDKQIQNHQARRIKIWSRIVAVLAVLGVLAAVGLFIWSYLIPYFQQEFILPAANEWEEDPLLTGSMAPLPVYDSMGLPVYDNDMCLFVINGASPADASFEPMLTTAEGVAVDARIADALRELCAAARADGLALVFTEGYVSYEDQGKRFDEMVDELMNGESGLTAVMAKTKAGSLQPEAGKSDFQTGLCLRLSGDPETFTESRTYSWLRANMGKYGFIFRYPDGKQDMTGMEPAPTVIRYVGSANAAAMQQRSMCLEEYITYLGSQ